MTEKRLEINLFGACIVRSRALDSYELTGAKHKALFALLATAPFGRRTRGFLQETLWGTSCYDSGRQSLRRALSDIKRVMGDDYEALISSTYADIRLDLTQVDFIGRPGSGEFLEGLNLREDGFNRWLTSLRLDPNQVHGLFSIASQAPARPALPVVAVMPFRTLDTHSDQAILGDWLAEEVTRSLSRSHLLAVVSHLSTRQLASRMVDIVAVREKLGADFCLSGALRPSGNGLTLDIDFIDARTGHVIWTRRSSGPFDDFLTPEAPGIDNVVRSVGASIADEAMRHIHGRALNAIDDHRLLTADVALMHRPTLKEFAQARSLIEEAIQRAPRAAEAHAWLGKWHVLAVFNDWSTDPQRDTMRAIDSTAAALDLDPDNAFALTIDGFAHNNLLKRLDIAASRYSSALRSNPNEALAWLMKGMIYAFTDQPEDAVAHVTQARTLSPLDPFVYFYDSLQASACLAAGDYQKVLDLSERSLASNDRHLSTIRARITALHHLDRGEDARAAAKDLIRRQPDFTVADYVRHHPAGAFKLGRTVADALRASGIPSGD